MASSFRSRLLVADDDPEWRKIIASLLECHCDLVGIVERGDQVLEAAQRVFPDVITLDISMPGESGLHALPRLRATFPSAIIIIVSNTATEVYMEEAFVRGADGYVEKGRVRSHLVNAIASAQDQRHQEVWGRPA